MAKPILPQTIYPMDDCFCKLWVYQEGPGYGAAFDNAIYLCKIVDT